MAKKELPMYMYLIQAYEIRCHEQIHGARHWFPNPCLFATEEEVVKYCAKFNKLHKKTTVYVWNKVMVGDYTGERS
jgi:hypothetical protein